MPNWVYYIGPNQDITLDQIYDKLRSITSGHVAVDVETVSLTDKRCIGVGVAWSSTEAVYFGTWEGSDKYPAQCASDFGPLLHVLAHPGVEKVIFNIGFDFHIVRDRLGIYPQPWQDLSIMCHVQGLPNSLEECVGLILYKPHPLISNLLQATGKTHPTMLDVPFVETARKCCTDVMHTIELYDQMSGAEWADMAGTPIWHDSLGFHNLDITPEIRDAYFLDKNCLPLLWRMGERGLKLNQERLQAHYERVSTELYDFYNICKTQHNFDPGSNQQVGLALAKRGNFLDFTPSGRQLKVDDEALRDTGDPLAHIVLAYRSRVKTRGTYCVPWLGQERAYTHFRLDLATGRTASFDRNMQNIPAEMRNIFTPDSGTWTNPDHSQIEMRIFAHISGSKPMQEAYRLYDAKEGPSIHVITMQAAWPGEPRYVEVRGEKMDNPLYLTAKTGNFAMLYDAEDSTLAKNTRLTQGFWREFKAAWKTKYEVTEWLDWAKVEGMYRQPSPYVQGLDGRRYHLPDPSERGEKHTMTCGINYRVQGPAATALKRGLLICDRQGFDMPGQVHDEYLIDGDVEMPEEVGWVLEDVYTPVETKKGPTWN